MIHSQNNSGETYLSLGRDIHFSTLNLSNDELILTGVSEKRKHVVKIELSSNSAKVNDLEGEFKVMRHLNRRGCVTCPVAHEFGGIEADQLRGVVDDAGRKAMARVGGDRFNYLLQEYVPFGAKALLGDMILAYLEQKSLGVYHGDANPKNIRFDERGGVCYLIDYDQAEFLSEDVVAMGNLDFLDWCNQRARRRYDLPMFMNFKNFDFDKDVLSLFRGDAFNLGETTLYKRQKTTLSAGGIYHRIDFDQVFAEGERDIHERTRLLDQVEFDSGEKVLDVGCNAGLLSFYLADRGCAVTGIDLDSSIIAAARIIANIIGRKVRFFPLDLDAGRLNGVYDTIMLFSVIHHTQNIEANAQRVASHCRRILIESRLVEKGAKPVGNQWVRTTVWEFADLDEMIAAFERMFPGFRFARNLGQVDRSRHILELVKDGGA